MFIYIYKYICVDILIIYVYTLTHLRSRCIIYTLNVLIVAVSTAVTSHIAKQLRDKEKCLYYVNHFVITLMYPRVTCFHDFDMNIFLGKGRSIIK